MEKQIWAIGDIHGFHEPFVEILKKIGFLDEQGRIYEKQDNTLVLVGDYIDRGSKPLEVLYLIDTLVSHGQAIALLGNHDNWLFRRLKGASPVINAERQATLDAITSSPLFGENTWRDLLDIYTAMPYFYSLGDFKFAHAIYSDSGAKSETKKKREYMLYGPTDKNAISEKGLPVRIPWYETYDGRCGDIIFGHYSLSHEIEEFPHAVCVDCGTYKTGVFGAYEVLSGKKEYVNV